MDNAYRFDHNWSTLMHHQFFLNQLHLSWNGCAHHSMCKSCPFKMFQGSFETPFQCEGSHVIYIYIQEKFTDIIMWVLSPAAEWGLLLIGDRFFQNMRYACWVYFRRSLPSLATVEFKFSKKSMKLARPCSCHAHVWILHHTSFKIQDWI